MWEHIVDAGLEIVIGVLLIAAGALLAGWLELARDKDLLLKLRKSQETRGAQLAKAREREAALLRQLDALGVDVEGHERESFFKTKATKHP